MKLGKYIKRKGANNFSLQVNVTRRRMQSGLLMHLVSLQWTRGNDSL